MTWTTAAGLGVVALAAARAAAQQRPDTAARNKQVVRAAFDGWARGGTGFYDVLSDDVVWTIEGAGPTAGVYRGKRDFLARAAEPLAARLSTQVRPTVRGLWADGDHVVIRFDGDGVARDGRPYHNAYVWIFRMRGGRAAEVTAFLDLAAYDRVIRDVPPAR